jgi:hypothetical protein
MQKDMRRDFRHAAVLEKSGWHDGLSVVSHRFMKKLVRV